MMLLLILPTSNGSTIISYKSDHFSGSSLEKIDMFMFEDESEVSENMLLVLFHCTVYHTCTRLPTLTGS